VLEVRGTVQKMHLDFVFRGALGAVTL
jgi:hypothetical protein